MFYINTSEERVFLSTLLDIDFKISINHGWGIAFLDIETFKNGSKIDFITFDLYRDKNIIKDCQIHLELIDEGKSAKVSIIYEDKNICSIGIELDQKNKRFIAKSKILIEQDIDPVACEAGNIIENVEYFEEDEETLYCV